MRGGKSKTSSGSGKTGSRGAAGKPTKAVGQRGGRTNQSSSQRKKPVQPMPKFAEDVRLNKYLANAGICSRREADVLIGTGVVTVNGEIITELGFKVKPTDVVRYDGATINPQTKRYVLLNKPKDFVTRADDPLGRRNAYTLVAKSCKEFLFPVDKMGREDMGLILYSNDGDMIKKLSHPRLNISRIYHLVLNKPINPEHLEQLSSGVRFGEDVYKLTAANQVQGKSLREIGVEIRIGRFRMIERMLEKLGYSIDSADRVQFGPLTKKDLPRGFFRHLTEQEVAFLKMM
jgi:23S rRNA pseudouridine2605 synthase